MIILHIALYIVQFVKTMINEIDSQRGTNKYNHEGYTYVKDKSSANKMIIHWRCDKRKRQIWTQTDNGRFDSLRTPHTCSTIGNVTNVVVQKVVTAAKRRAVSTMEIPSQVRQEVIQNVPTSVLGQLPSVNALRKQIQRKRSKQQQAPPNPNTREDIIIPIEYTRYEYMQGQFENFLLADSGEEQPDPNRILLFGRNYSGTWSHQMRELFMDGRPAFKHGATGAVPRGAPLMEALLEGALFNFIPFFIFNAIKFLLYPLKRTDKTVIHIFTLANTRAGKYWWWQTIFSAALC